MSNLADLDLTDSEDPVEQAQRIETFYKNDTAQKIALAYHWERNALMLSGHHWLVYQGNSATGGMWQKLQPTPQNEYIPRPVTNYIFDAYQTLKSYLLKNKPRSTVRPNTQLNRDKEAAKIAELILECNFERLQETENYEYAASCLITYGTVFKKDFWDTSAPLTAKVPRMVQIPITDPNTGAPTGGTEEVQATDPTTNLPIFDELPLGDLNTAIIEPFRMALDPLAVNIHEARWIMEYSIRPLSWIVENFDKQEPGYTGRAQEVTEEKSLSASMRRFYQLKTSSGFRGIMSGNSAGEMVDNAAVVKEYYQAPTRKHPKGRLIVIANGIPLYSGDSPYQGPELGDWHPYSECRWEPVPDRFWAKGPFDDACEIQKQINSIDSIVALTRQTSSVPQKLVPKTAQVTAEWTGQPGQKVDYTPGANGEKPEVIQGSGVHPQVFEERKQKVEDFKQITGAVDILKGDRPPGVTAASALSLLYEVGTGKLFPVLDRWKRFNEKSGKKQLRIIAIKYREPRPEFIQMLLSKNTELTEEQIKSFVGKDLYDNCNVVIEASSAIPKLKAAEQALLLELASQNLLNLDNPKNRQEFLSRFGVIGFDDSYSKDVTRAQWENDLLDNLLADPDEHPVLLQTDDHQVHYQIHADRTKEPSFMSLPGQIQQAYFEHIMEHEQAMQQAQQMQQMQAMVAGAPAQPQQPPAPMQAQQHVKAAKPLGDKMRNALSPDIFGPNPLTST